MKSEVMRVSSLMKICLGKTKFFQISIGTQSTTQDLVLKLPFPCQDISPKTSIKTSRKTSTGTTCFQIGWHRSPKSLRLKDLQRGIQWCQLVGNLQSITPQPSMWSLEQEIIHNTLAKISSLSINLKSELVKLIKILAMITLEMITLQRL